MPPQDPTTKAVRRDKTPRVLFLMGAIAIAVCVGLDVLIALLADPDRIPVLIGMFSLGAVFFPAILWSMAIQRGLGARIDPEAILAGLHSPDESTRLSSAKRLSFLTGPDATAAALACLTDSVAAVRYYGLRHLAAGIGRHDNRLNILATLLCRTDAAGNEARTAVLEVLGNIGGTESPFRGLDGRITQGDMSRNVYLCVRAAIDRSRTESPDLARQMLVELARQKRMPAAKRSLQASEPWHAFTQDSFSVVWPRRCHKCGAPNPAAQVYLTDSHTEDMKTRTVAFTLPACVECPRHDSSATALVHVGLHTTLNTVSISGLNPDFVADLLNLNAEWEV
jgi:hypothetical protein